MAFAAKFPQKTTQKFNANPHNRFLFHLCSLLISSQIDSPARVPSFTTAIHFISLFLSLFL
jgi:hypothetical protein